MVKQVSEYVRKERMLEPNDTVVLGVSGGADSVCLFFLMLALQKEYQLSLVVVHVNHGLRGTEADQDEQYVKELCQAHKIPCHIVSGDVRAMADREKLSEEEAGRLLRYQAFEQVARECRADKIAVAHHENDNAETVLFQLFRGSGLKGMAGIAPVRGNIIRPMLQLQRQEIEAYLDNLGVTYCTDATNLTTEYTRNRIRLDLLPYVTEHINRNAIEHIVAGAQDIKEAWTYIRSQAEKICDMLVRESDGTYHIPVAEYSRQETVIKKELVRILLEKMTGGLKDITREHVERIVQLCDKQVGKEVQLPNRVVARREYEAICLSIAKIEDKQRPDNGKKKEDTFSYSVDVIPGKYYISQTNQYVEFTLEKYKKNLIIPQNGCTKWFDYDKINNTLTLRNRNEGDYLIVDAKHSRKKLKAFFIDQKVPQTIRNHILLVAEGSHILWVTGHRISEAYKIDENTKNILIVKVYGGNENGTQN